MSGKKQASLYFHIPFCTRKCPYCHFYVIPNKQEHRELLLDALLLEWGLIAPQLSDYEIVSIYFGGGTPSLFGVKPIEALLQKVFEKSSVSLDCEITLEANPEDVTLSLIQGYRESGVNRISMGVQSLYDPSLKILERTHDAKKALEAIGAISLGGISNLSIDLMYDLPHQTRDDFLKTLEALKGLPITHLSLYNLTIEPHTPFSKRKLTLPTQEESLSMLQEAVSHLEACGLNRYEISAFAKPGFHSIHNTGYWTARPFFGLGPSAFSYFNGSRFRNVANLNKYVAAIKKGDSPVDFEERLPYPQNVLELLTVRLRMLDGVDLQDYPLPAETHPLLERLVQEGLLQRKKGRLQLTERGLLFYDTVATEII